MPATRWLQLLITSSVAALGCDLGTNEIAGPRPNPGYTMTITPGSLAIEQGATDSVAVNGGFVRWSAGTPPAGVSLLGFGATPSTAPNWEPDRGTIRIVVASNAPPDTATIWVGGEDNDGYGAGASFFLEVLVAAPQVAGRSPR